MYSNPKLKGFGEVADGLLRELDPGVDALVEIVGRIKSVVARAG
jgi:hypothetical protein